MRPLSTEARTSLIDAMMDRFGVAIGYKRSNALMSAISTAFGFASMLGAGTPPDFDAYWTTIGPIVFLPRHVVGVAPEHLGVMAHEVTHAAQWHRDGIAYVAGYVASVQERAVFEAECERARFEVAYLCGDALPTTLAELDFMRHGYAVGGAHADLCRDLCEQHLASVSSGVISTDVGLFVREWLAANGVGDAAR